MGRNESQLQFGGKRKAVKKVSKKSSKKVSKKTSKKGSKKSSKRMNGGKKIIKKSIRGGGRDGNEIYEGEHEMHNDTVEKYNAAIEDFSKKHNIDIEKVKKFAENSKKYNQSIIYATEKEDRALSDVIYNLHKLDEKLTSGEIKIDNVLEGMK